MGRSIPGLTSRARHPRRDSPMASLWTQPLAEFRDATASAEPTPGGGSVAMVSATLGLGLVLMALEITRKKPDPGKEETLNSLLKEGRELLAKLGEHADHDIAVFQRYMAALRLPKGTEPEKAVRKQAMSDALLAATEAPLTAAADCNRALEIACAAADEASVRVVSD